MEAVGEYGGLDLSQSTAVEDIGSGYTAFQNEDVVVAKITPCFENGKGALAEGLLNGLAFGTTELHVLRATPRIDARFLFYVSISDPFRSFGEAEMYGAGGQKRVPTEFVKDFRLPFPKLAEQRAIAAFLDRETARIDALIEKKRLLIERLEEQRAALISRTVTRGLPPEAARAVGLDPSPRLKPSGVEWLGDVPEHWDVKRLKFEATYRTSSVDKKAADGEVPVRLCNYTDVYYRDHIRASDGDFMEATATPAEKQRFHLQVGDLLITKDSEDWRDIAVPALVEETADDFVCGYHLGIIRPSLGVYPPFMLRVFQSGAVNQQFQIAATGVTRYGMPNAAAGNAVVPIPPLSEQRAIAAFLDSELSRLHEVTRVTQSAIERLQEYRSALISAAVTGKIDVRDSARELATVK